MKKGHDYKPGKPKAIALIKLSQQTCRAWDFEVNKLLERDDVDLGEKIQLIAKSLSENPFYHQLNSASTVSGAFGQVWAEILAYDTNEEQDTLLANILSAARPQQEEGQGYFLSHLQTTLTDPDQALRNLKLIMTVAKRWGATRGLKALAELLMPPVLGRSIKYPKHSVAVDELFKHAKKDAKSEINEVDQPWVGVWAKCVLDGEVIVAPNDFDEYAGKCDLALDHILSLGADINAEDSNSKTCLFNIGSRYNESQIHEYIISALTLRGARWRDLLHEAVNPKALDIPQVRAARLREQLAEIAQDSDPVRDVETKKHKPAI